MNRTRPRISKVYNEGKSKTLSFFNCTGTVKVPPSLYVEMKDGSFRDVHKPLFVVTLFKYFFVLLKVLKKF